MRKINYLIITLLQEILLGVGLKFLGKKFQKRIPIHSSMSDKDDCQQSERCLRCDESVSRGRETGTKGRETGTKGRRTGTIGTKERGNEKPYGLVQIEYWDRGTSPRHVWTWRGRVTPFLDV